MGYNKQISIFPQPFKSQYNHVKYEMQADGVMVFNHSSKLKHIETMQITGWSPDGRMSKLDVKDWAQHQINNNPEWVDIAKDVV